MQFGLYLVKQGVITSAEFVEALEHQFTTRPQLGALAIELGLLSVREVFFILRAQANDPKEMFGELAISESLLTEDELVGLLYRQSLRAQPIGQIVVELGFASADEIERHLTDYRAKCHAKDTHQMA